PKDMLRWKVVDALSGKNRKDPGGFVIPQRVPDHELIHSGKAQLTWIGHASFLLTLGKKHILIDPIFAPGIATVSRLSPPGLLLAELPKVDMVLITHNHRDHLDPYSIARLGSDPAYIAPLGNGRVLAKYGATQITELDWWEQTSQGGLTIT